LRHKDDAFNSFISGGFTSILVTAGALGPKGVFMSGIGGGIFGMVMYKV
jgi:import inner membrane translocase subunit TIM22